MSRPDNRYLSLTTYPEIYRELVYQRNEAIRWLQEHGLSRRDRHVAKSNRSQWERHKAAAVYRPIFQENIVDLLDRLYSHDAVEAIYDFESADLNGWSDTEANWLERELQALQKIIGKLEVRYNLQYKLVIEYVSKEHTLYLNGIEIFACGPNTLRHRLLTALYSKPQKLWQNQTVEDYFIKHFSYTEGQLSDKNIEKAGNDIKKDVAAQAGAKDFLIVSNASVRINPFYLA